MELTFYPVITINLAFCVVVAGLGIWGYLRRKSIFLLYFGIAYVLFSISHLIVLLALEPALEYVLMAIRVIAYLFLILALYKAAK